MKALDFSLHLLRSIRNNTQMTGQEIEVLFAVANKINTSTAIADFYNMQRTTATALLKRLRIAGLVIPTGKRIYEYKLSATGKDAVARTLSFLTQ